MPQAAQSKVPQRRSQAQPQLVLAALARAALVTLLHTTLPCLAVATAIAADSNVSPAPLSLRPPEYLMLGGTVLDVGDYAVPTVADWNRDGRKDLVVGYRPADKIALFLNTGTATNPQLAYAGNLQAGGFDIMVAGGSGCGAPAPWVGDFDGDADPDLLVGSAPDGTVILFRNNSTNTTPVLANGTRLALWNGDPLTVGTYATPCFSDWDGDAIPDLICGAGDGTVFFFKNIGSAKSPLFSAGLRLLADGKQLSLGSRAVPRLCDWDNDGLIDLIASSSTGVYWCRNYGTTTSPTLAKPVPLTAPIGSGQIVPVNTSNRMRMDLADWDGDSLPDLILGNTEGTICWFQSYRFAITMLTRSADGQTVVRWNSSPYLFYSVVTGPSVTTCKDVVATGITSGGTMTSWTNRFIRLQQFFRIRTP